MKRLIISLLAAAAFSHTAFGQPKMSVYHFPPIVWKGTSIEGSLPMLCDDNYFNAVAIYVPGKVAQDFSYRIQGDLSCKLQSMSYSSSKGYSRLLILNTGRCLIQVQSRLGRATYDLADAC